jgi:hypothetical protein
MSAEGAEMAECTEQGCTTKTNLRCDPSTGVGCGEPFCGEHLFATDRNGYLCAVDYNTAVDQEGER